MESLWRKKRTRKRIKERKRKIKRERELKIEITRVLINSAKIPRTLTK